MNIAVGILIVVGAGALAFAVLALVRRGGRPVLGNPTRGTPMAIVAGTSNAVLLAFVILAAFQTYNSARAGAAIEANARPRFRVGVNASVTAGVDLLVTEIEHTWGPWRRTLGEFGPSLELGVTIPVRWSEQEGLAFSVDDIQVRRPEISVTDILKSSFEEVV